MVPPVVASLPHLRPDNSSNSSFMGAWRYAFVEAPFGLRRKKFQMAPPKARAPMPITLANFATKTLISANRPSFFATTPPTSAAIPYSAIWSVAALKSSYPLPGLYESAGQQLVRRILVGVDAARTRQQLRLK